MFGRGERVLKGVYIYFIDGKKIAVWARSIDEAKERIEEVLGNVKAEFIGIFIPKLHDRYSGIGHKPDIYLEDIEDSGNHKCIKDLEKLGWQLVSSNDKYIFKQNKVNTVIISNTRQSIRAFYDISKTTDDTDVRYPLTLVRSELEAFLQFMKEGTDNL